MSVGGGGSVTVGVGVCVSMGVGGRDAVRVEDGMAVSVWVELPDWPVRQLAKERTKSQSTRKKGEVCHCTDSRYNA